MFLSPLLDHIYEFGVGIAQFIKRLATCWTAGIRFPAGVSCYSLLYSVQIVSATTQPPAQRVTEAVSSGVKRMEREAGHSPPSSAEVTNAGAIPPFPHTLVGCSVNEAQV
jgi:hypothetical protein